MVCLVNPTKYVPRILITYLPVWVIMLYHQFPPLLHLDFMVCLVNPTKYVPRILITYLPVWVIMLYHQFQPLLHLDKCTSDFKTQNRITVMGVIFERR